MPATTSTPVYSTDYYMSLLSALPNVQKLDIISRLSASLVKKEKKKVKKTNLRAIVDSFEGDWGGEMSSVEYANTLRNEMPAERDFDTW